MMYFQKTFQLPRLSPTLRADWQMKRRTPTFSLALMIFRVPSDWMAPFLPAPSEHSTTSWPCIALSTDFPAFRS